MTRINASSIEYARLNQMVRECQDSEIILDGVMGQRYIGCGMAGRRIVINGTPGNALGAYLDGSELIVNGGAQDAVGDTMDSGKIIINGRSGDTAGYAMRGGCIYVRGSVGYRAGIHMKEYNDKSPVLVIGGNAGSFLGEYQAGGLIIVLGLDKSGPIIGNFCGTGMHGGKIFLRTDELPAALPRQVSAQEASPEELADISGHIRAFCAQFELQPEQVLAHKFIVLSPDTGNPYRQLYTPN